MTEKTRSLIDIGIGELQDIVNSFGEPGYRARQITAQVYRRLARSYDEMTDIPIGLRGQLASNISLHSLAPVHLAEAGDGTVKGLFSLLDGSTVETALMMYRRSGSEGKRGTVCVSSQVGCVIGCPFCATGQQGFERNLTRGEIVDQVLFFARYLQDSAAHQENERRTSLTNIVFMGMGEPLANYEELIAAIRMLNSTDGLAMGARNMTVSTSGLVPKILELADEGIQVGLAVSLHAGTNGVRDRLVPLNRTYPLEDVVAACKEYFRLTGRRVSFEYVLFRGLNDSLSEAKSLGRLLHRMNCHINLIPANITDSPLFQPPPRDIIMAFQDELRAAHVTTTVRQSRGQEIGAGCGQLRSRILKEAGKKR